MKLTELENAVLGFVWRDGPCSAYAIQRVFEAVSTGWSGSPGSLYPLLKRLERQHLVASTKQVWGKRTKSLFQITERGSAQLCNWVATVPDWAGRPPADPIRTKTFFLQTLKTDRNRQDFIAAAETATRASIKRLQEGLLSLSGPQLSYDRLAQIGGIYQLQARLDWLEEVRETLSNRPNAHG